MPKGTVKKVTDKGFGFITVPDSEDVFFHMSALAPGVSFEGLQPGQAVTFDMGSGPKGPKAENVQLVTAA